MDSTEALGAFGPFARRIAGFTSRPGQQQMAAAIERAIQDQSTLITESGTGTGKTLAYLVPAWLSGRKVLISTGTRNLQDQLFQRDIPMVQEILGRQRRVALLKGRANYLCLHRLDRATTEARFTRRVENEWFARLRDWSAGTRTGDISELGEVPEDAELWPWVTSSPENCLGTRCDRFDDCFVNRARRDALEADLLVVNHYLFFADLALKEDGFGQLLPGAEAVIFDEAHQLPEIATNFFGLHLSSYQLQNLCRDSIAEELKEQSAAPGLVAAAERADKSVADLRLAFGVEETRGPWDQALGRPEFVAALTELRTRMTDLTNCLDQAAPRGPGLANCFRRASVCLDRILMLCEGAPAEFVTWFETSRRGFVLRMTPLDIAGPFRSCTTDHPRTWIFTSATLAVDGQFDHFRQQLGLNDASTAIWASPFDYARQALLYFPSGLPEPAAPDYTERLLAAVLPVIHASRGRAFLLFTSHRALRVAADWLTGKFEYPMLVQGRAPRTELLEQFRAHGNAVLLGTGSFWEGVDVRGEALSLVVIDKLPFAAPDDPVFRARAALMEQEGQNPFSNYQLPNAAIALKQGAGRLIRDIDDRGVLVVGDPRLLRKSYGRTFLASLPPMRQTRDIAEVQEFFGKSEPVPADSEIPAIST